VFWLSILTLIIYFKHNGDEPPQEQTNSCVGWNVDISPITVNFFKITFPRLLFQGMYWILGRKSELSLANKVLLYKSIRKRIWTYGIPFWGTASRSNIEILQRFQNKAVRTMVNAPWYVPNILLHTDLQLPTIREEITKFSANHRAKLLTHPNNFTSNLLTEQGPGRLKWYKPFDLTTRFSWLACKMYFEHIHWNIAH